MSEGGGLADPSDGSADRSSAGSAAGGPRDVGLGIVLLGSVAALAYSVAEDADLHQDFGQDPGPAFLPNLLLGLLAIGAVILVIRGLLLLARAGWRVSRPMVDISRSNVPMLLVASIVLYVLLVPTLGALALSLIFAIAWAAGLSLQDHGTAARPLLVSAVGSAIIAVGIYLTFRQLIGIPLR